jgi:hypothetical protein
MPEVPENPEPVVEITPFTLRSDYASALDRVLALARSEVLVLDRDLADGGWGSPARIEVLRAFLLGRRDSRLQIVVHDTTQIERNLPRLTILLRDFSHKFSILRTLEDARNASEGFVLVDGRHLVHRFHFDSMRGELAIHSPLKAVKLRDLYDDIIPFTEPGVNATLLGL